MIPISKEILDKASRGDMAAFEEIYKLSCDFVYNVALRITRNSADAQEVAQDVFMKIYRSLNDFQFRSAFKTRVYRITVNTAINRYRKSARESKGRVDYESIAATTADSRSTLDGLVRNDDEQRINTLLAALSPQFKACLVLREIEGLSYREIADSLKIPVNTVRSRLKRARQALLAQARKELN